MLEKVKKRIAQCQRAYEHGGVAELWQAAASPKLYGVMENERARADHMEDLAHRDAKMDIPNYRAYLRYIEAVKEFYDEQVQAGAEKSRFACGLYMFDIDKFKEVNTMLGHEYADLVLEELGRRLRSTFRDNIPLDLDNADSPRGETAKSLENWLRQNKIFHYDFAARHGGEEIAIVAPFVYDEEPGEGIVTYHAEMVANRIRNIFREPIRIPATNGLIRSIKNYLEENSDAFYRNLKIVEEGGQKFIDLPVTVSIGFVAAELEFVADPLTRQNADALAQYVKDNGRNGWATAVGENGVPTVVHTQGPNSTRRTVTAPSQ